MRIERPGKQPADRLHEMPRLVRRLGPVVATFGDHATRDVAQRLITGLGNDLQEDEFPLSPSGRGIGLPLTAVAIAIDQPFDCARACLVVGTQWRGWRPRPSDNRIVGSHEFRRAIVAPDADVFAFAGLVDDAHVPRRLAMAGGVALQIGRTRARHIACRFLAH